MVKPQTIALSGYADTLDIPYNPDEDPWCGSMTIRYPQKKGVWTKKITNCNSPICLDTSFQVLLTMQRFCFPRFYILYIVYMYIYVHIWRERERVSQSYYLHVTVQDAPTNKTLHCVCLGESSKIAFKLGSDNELTKITEAIVLSSC